MRSSRDLADHVLVLAQTFIAAHRAEVLARAAGDIELIVHATNLLRTDRSDAPEAARTPEHVAFALLTAVFHDAASSAARHPRRLSTGDTDQTHRPRGLR